MQEPFPTLTTCIHEKQTHPHLRTHILKPLKTARKTSDWQALPYEKELKQSQASAWTQAHAQAHVSLKTCFQSVLEILCTVNLVKHRPAESL